MKKIILVLILFTSTAKISFAQSSMEEIAAKVSDGSFGIGDALTGFGKGINKSAFGDKWPSVSEQWFKSSGNVKDVKGAVKSINTLTANLKPEAFTQDFYKSKKNWDSKLLEMKSLSEIGSLMKNLIDGLASTSFTKDFIEYKETFMKGLDSLK